MNRRTLLATLGLGGTIFGGIGVRELSNASKPRYQQDERVVYEHPDLFIHPLEETPTIGDEIVFEITNTSDSKVVLGCNNPWALQRLSDGEWQHVVWTGQRYYDMCASLLGPAETYRERLELSKSGLETHTEEIHSELRPGRYRLLLVGVSPILATDFDLLAPK